MSSISIVLPASAVPTDTVEQEVRAEATYYPWFDWLRATCAIAVMLYHEGLLPWANSGRFAVEVFFALSGWLIGGILLKVEPSHMPRFYFNRAIRIWAPYYLAVGLALGLAVLRDPITAKWLEIVAYELTFVFNLFGWTQSTTFLQAFPLKGTQNQVWSVNAEEQFYLLAPLILVSLRPRLGRAQLTWAVLGALAFFTAYTSIVLGVFCAVVAHHGGRNHLSKNGRAATAVVLAAAVAAMAVGVNFYRVAPVAAICIVLLLAVPGKQHRFGELWGGMSYPLYLNHWIGAFAANYLVGAARRETPLKFVITIVSNILLAMAMYWWIDRRLIANRARYFTPARGKVVTAIAYGMIAVGCIFGWIMVRAA